MEHMSRAEKRCILGRLGIDVDALKHTDYGKTLILERIREFCSFNDRLEAALRAVMKDSGLRWETRETAA